MERLTKRDEHGKVSKVKSSRNTYVCTILEEEAKFDQEVLDRLAEYEDAEEAGLIKRLPCKVGDTVYLPWVYGGVCSIAYLTVTNIILDTKKSYIRTDFETDSEDYWEKYKGGQYDFSDFGKIIFTNKAEAEAKLKEL